ncbi:Elongation of very long chain fatty acids protein [Sergentomyia squamirostris]
MLLIVQKLFEFWTDLDRNHSHPLSQYPLVKNPLSIVALTALYLLFVQKWGPNMMKKRKPCHLRRIIIIYNGLQIAINAFIFLGISRIFFRRYNLKCQPVDYSVTPETIQLARICYLYCLLKVFDFMDTVFFVLRKKDAQMSFLHRYHHAIMAVFCSLLFKFVPNSHFVLLAIVNSFVHVVMYAYYELTALNPNTRRHLWWKKHLTQLQILQFGIIGIHLISALIVDCGLPKFLLISFLIQTLFMVLMFSEFYYKNYIVKKRKTSERITEK